MTLMDDVTVQYKGLNSVTYSILFYKAFSITYLYYAKIRMLIWLKIKYENPDNTSYEFQPSCDVRDLHPCNTI